MKRKLIAILAIFALALSLAACGGGEETTVTGMVVSVEGTVISLVEMGGNRNFNRGEGMPEGFDPENMPQRPQGFDPENMPEGFDPENMPQRPQGGERPEGSEGGERPQGGRGNMENMETKQIDIANAHISVQIDGGKASGTMDDIKPGTMVTVTLSAKGASTNVLVSR